MNNLDLLFHGILLNLSDTHDVYILLNSCPKLICYISKYKLKSKLIDPFTIKKIRFNNTQEWYSHGKLHRDNDLPAVIYANGTQEWWLNGKRYK